MFTWRSVAVEDFWMTYLACPKMSPTIRIAPSCAFFAVGLWLEGRNKHHRGIWQEEWWERHVLLRYYWPKTEWRCCCQTIPRLHLAIECTTCRRCISPSENFQKGEPGPQTWQCIFRIGVATTTCEHTTGWTGRRFKHVVIEQSLAFLYPWNTLLSGIAWVRASIFGMEN